jgi:hypothetical protein
MNSLPEWLQPLEFLTRPFPAEAMAAAIERREESTPHLLRALEWAEQNSEDANYAEPPYMLHIFALFILAEFRETRAYPLIVRLFRHPEHEELTSDIDTESLDRILASVCGGDTTLIEALIEDPAVDEYVRSGAVNSLSVLIHTGSKTRAEISAYFGHLLNGGLQADTAPVWNGIVMACVDNGMTEHLESIRRLYREGLADPFFDTLEEVEKQIVLPPSDRRSPDLPLTFITDAIAELEKWHCFTLAAAEEEEAAAADFDDLDLLPEDEPLFPIMRETPKIGRNDQCPCGSGKKFKKCCGALGAN